ncbi:hypothetical protein KAI46_08825 [bacterium]|nr:hypothetical protein [bacterium]
MQFEGGGFVSYRRLSGSLLVAVGIALLLLSCATSHKTRELVRPISLTIPSDYRMASYLGFFKPRRMFFLTEIKTEILVANVFQTRCPHCQGLTDDLNKLYKTVKKEGFFHKVKFIGLGYGEDFLEVEYYKKRYAIPYPLFADPRAEKVKVKNIPATFILRMTPAGAKVLYEYYGPLPSAKDLLQIIRAELTPTS